MWFRDISLYILNIDGGGRGVPSLIYYRQHENLHFLAIGLNCFRQKHAKNCSVIG